MCSCEKTFRALTSRCVRSGPIPLDPLPEHLRRYIPNAWGASRSLAKSFVNMTEQGIYMKVGAGAVPVDTCEASLTKPMTFLWQCCVLIANRELLDEELFVDHQYVTRTLLLVHCAGLSR